MEGTSPASKDPRARKRVYWTVFVLTGLGLAVVLLHPQQQLAEARDWISRLGPWAPWMFILIYALACVFLIPGSALTLAAGALFGVVRGSLIVSAGATLGATAAFLVGRHLTRRWVEEWLKRFPRFAAVERAVAREGWKVVLLTRLSPVFPFIFLNYAFGLTQVSLRDYLVASWIGMLPGTVLYVYLGTISGAVVDAAGGRAASVAPARWAMLGIGLVSTLAVTLLITRLARQALNDTVDRP
ncbi:MAG: TVP38/TMEM64 family protein [Verrucomicrobiota bacterium]